jgi:exosortase F-associated protein
MRRYSNAIIGIIGLALIYLFQDNLIPLTFQYPNVSIKTAFIIKKSVRVVLNDTCMLLIIHAWFSDIKISRTAVWIQGFDTFILLPIYLLLKLYFEGVNEISNPFLSQLHRLIINPTLMILYIPSIYYQRVRTK